MGEQYCFGANLSLPVVFELFHIQLNLDLGSCLQTRLEEFCEKQIQLVICQVKLGKQNKRYCREVPEFVSGIFSEIVNVFLLSN